MNVAELAITCVFAVPIVAIICGTITAIVNKDKKNRSNPDDIQLIQELHHGLSRMEKRIEALETILYDEYGKRGR